VRAMKGGDIEIMQEAVAPPQLVRGGGGAGVAERQL